MIERLQSPKNSSYIGLSISRYGVFHLIWIGLCFTLTRLFFPMCRLIRFPIFIRGKRNIVFGRDLVTGYFNRLDAFGAVGCLTVGDRVQINDGCHIGAITSVTIGNDVLIASRVFISDHNHGGYFSNPDGCSPDEPPELRTLVAKPVRIGNRVWIGEAAILLPGVTVGEGSVIGAGAVVRNNIPPESIAVGNPARVIGHFDRHTGRWVRG